MSLKVGELVAELGLDSKGFDLKLAGIDGKLNKGIGGFFGGLPGMAGTALAGVGAAVAGTVIKGVADFAGFDRKMREVFTLMPDISQGAMGEMTDQVKDFAVEFAVLPDEVVPALYQSISAGVPPDNVFDFLETSQKAAKGGVTELEVAVDGISSVVNAYGEDVLGATAASDLMFTAVKLGKTTFDELAGSLFNVVPTAAAVGVNFGDITAALAAMTAQGTPTTVATTQLRQMLVELTKEGSATADTFEEIAGKSFKDFVRSGGDTQQALALLERHAKDAGLGVNDLFGSVEAGNAALALTGKGAATFRRDIDEMGRSAGATQTAYERMAGGLAQTWDEIKATVSVALLEIGEAAAPLAKDLAEDFSKGLKDLAEWIAANGDGIISFFGSVADAVKLAVDAVQWFVSANVELYDQVKAFDAEMIAKTYEPQLFNENDLRDAAERSKAIDSLKGQIQDLSGAAKNADITPEVRREAVDKLASVKANLIDILNTGPADIIGPHAVSDISKARTSLAEIDSDLKTIKQLEADGIISKTVAEDLRQKLKTARTNVQQGLAAIESQLAESGGKGGKQLIDEMYHGIISGTGKTRKAGRQVARSAGDGAASFNASQIGVNFGLGFASGISSTANNAYRSAAAIAQAAEAGIKTTGHVRSPSKLMRDLGVMFGEGFAIGLRSTRSLSIAAAVSVATATASAVANAIRKSLSGFASKKAKRIGKASEAAGPIEDLLSFVGDSIEILNEISYSSAPALTAAGRAAAKSVAQAAVTLSKIIANELARAFPKGSKKNPKRGAARTRLLAAGELSGPAGDMLGMIGDTMSVLEAMTEVDPRLFEPPASAWKKVGAIITDMVSTVTASLSGITVSDAVLRAAERLQVLADALQGVLDVMKGVSEVNAGSVSGSWSDLIAATGGMVGASQRMTGVGAAAAAGSGGMVWTGDVKIASVQAVNKKTADASVRYITNRVVRNIAAFIRSAR